MAKVLSLHLPSLAIDRRQRQRQRQSDSERNPPPPEAPPPERPPEAPSDAILLTAHEKNRQVVVQACGRSQRCGVKPGMSVAHARALLPQHVVVEAYRPEEEAATLHALARWALRFTPVVQTPPEVLSPEVKARLTNSVTNGLLLEITGCEHLHGGTRPMLQHVLTRIRRLGVQVQGAVGPTVGSAWALARFRPGAIIESLEEVAKALTPLPVRALRIEEEVEETLRGVAVETIGQLMALPRVSLAERFGDSLLLRLDQALGTAFEPIAPLRPSEPVWVERVFDGPVKQLEAILKTGRALAGELCRALLKCEAGVRQVRLEVERLDTHDLHETLMLSRPSRDAKHLWALLRPRLERMHLGFGVERIALHAVEMDRLAHQQTVAADWRASTAFAPDAKVGELIDQLTARFGAERVSLIETQQTHVPEQVFTHRPAQSDVASFSSETSVVDADRPTWLYVRPQPVRVVLLSPDGPVMMLAFGGSEGGAYGAETSGGGQARILSSIGPERITPRWWLVGDDRCKPEPRDYFKVQDELGRWWWLYRQVHTSRWFIHGRWC